MTKSIFSVSIEKRYLHKVSFENMLSTFLLLLLLLLLLLFIQDIYYKELIAKN